MWEFLLLGFFALYVFCFMAFSIIKSVPGIKAKWEREEREKQK